MNRKIKSLMALKDITVTEIAHKAGVSRTWVSLVIHKNKSSKRIRKAIADAVGKKYEELWPRNGNGRHNPPLTPPKRGILTESERD